MKRSYINKLIKNMKQKNKENNQAKDSTVKSQQFTSNLNENEEVLQEYFGMSQDVIFSKFPIKLRHGNEINAMLVAIDGIINEEAKRNNIINPLIKPSLDKSINLESIRFRLSVKTTEVEGDFIRVTNKILKSQVFLMIDGFSEGILIPIEGFEVRSIEEPDSEKTIRGSREGFVEAISVNLAMIRRRIAHPSIRFEAIEIGEYSRTDISIVYVKDIADPQLVTRVKKRLEQIKVDSINDSGEIEQLIEDHPYSIFSTIGNTERPDKAAALLMQGRVFVFVNGDPVSLYVPYLFVESIKNIEDYNSRPYYVSFVRLIRFFAFIISIALPALYISAINFNKALIPSDLVVSLTVARETVPFPLVLEISIVILMFEVVRESAVRLPKEVGTAISIVGPLILGDVAVQAGLMGSPTVIIVSISYIAAYVITSISDVTSLLRIILFIAASLFGSYGLTIILLAVFSHMVSLTSLGVPYMAPFSPLHFEDWKDAIIRFPTRLIRQREKSVPNQRSKKIKSVPNTGKKE